MVPDAPREQGGQSGELERDAEGSNSKLLNNSLDREPAPALGRRHQTALHRLRFRRYAVSRSEAISRHNAIGTITAVGSPASLETIWMSASGTTSVYLRRDRGEEPGGVAADERRCTPIRALLFICVHPCSSVAQYLVPL